MYVATRINVGEEFPYTSVRSGRWSFGGGTCVEADSTFVNEWIAPAARQRDGNGVQLPDIVVEISRTQRYEDLFERPFIFFSDAYPGVKAVVLIKLVESSAGIINQMIAVVYRRNAEGVPEATSAISFGRYLHPQTMQAILEHSRIDPHLFVGTGRHGMEEQCLEEGMAVFNLHVLAAASVWEHVPPNLIPPVQRDVNIDLFFIRNVLTRTGMAT